MIDAERLANPEDEQDPHPPRERFSTSAGWRLSVNPQYDHGFPEASVLSPAAQRMPSVTSATLPPHAPSTRIGIIVTFGATPEMPIPLSFCAAIIPATCVPCQEDAGLSSSRHQSPGSVASISRPDPSLAVADKLIMSTPQSSLTAASRSGCETMPVSITATMTLRSPVVRSQAPTALTEPPAPLNSAHW